MEVILDNVRSIYNVGSIFRTAEAAGIKKIYLGGYTPEPIDRFSNYRLQFVKVSLGAEKNVSWEKVKSTWRLLDKLKKEHYQILAVEQYQKSIPYYRFRVRDFFKEKIVLVFGNEVKGLSRAVLKRANKILEIPMLGKKESLNVSVAFAIVVFGLLYKGR